MASIYSFICDMIFFKEFSQRYKFQMPSVCGGVCELTFQTNSEFSFIAKERE